VRFIASIFFVFLFLPLLSHGQSSASAVRIGFYGPAVSSGGFIIGYRWEKVIDERFHVGFEGNWFNKSYVDKDLAKGFDDVFGVQGEVNELRAKTNLHAFPMQAVMEATFPINPAIRAFVNAGFGLDFLLLYYRDYDDPKQDRVRGAVDYSWRLGAGILYPLGRRSDFLAELAYHSSKPSWEYTVYDAASKKTRVFERIYDMSGLMLRIGVRFFY
jgi:hypothetical protein